MDNPLSWIDDELAALEQNHLRRRLATRDGPQSARLLIDGRELDQFRLERLSRPGRRSAVGPCRGRRPGARRLG